MKHENRLASLRRANRVRRHWPAPDVPSPGALDKLAPRQGRAHGHLNERRAEERLPTRHGYFRLRGVWGSYLFDNLFRLSLGIFFGFIFAGPILDLWPQPEAPVREPSGLAWAALFLLPLWVLIFLAFRWKYEYRIRRYMVTIGLLAGAMHAMLIGSAMAL